jgi:hypothetical protein
MLLPRIARVCRRCPLDVELTVTERSGRSNITAVGCDDHLAVFDGPWWLSTTNGRPAVETAAVKQDGSVCWWQLDDWPSGSDRLWMWAVGVVYTVL